MGNVMGLNVRLTPTEHIAIGIREEFAERRCFELSWGRGGLGWLTAAEKEREKADQQTSQIHMVALHESASLANEATV